MPIVNCFELQLRISSDSQQVLRKACVSVYVLPAPPQCQVLSRDQLVNNIEPLSLSLCVLWIMAINMRQQFYLFTSLGFADAHWVW